MSKEYVITLTRTMEAENENDAMEKFTYELDNNLYDTEEINIERS